MNAAEGVFARADTLDQGRPRLADIRPPNVNSDRRDRVRRIGAERFAKLREAEQPPFFLAQDPDRSQRPQ